MNFKKDLVIGNQGEDVVIENLKKFGAEFISKNNDNKFDVKMLYENIEILYEVKTDVYCEPKNDTGNLFVEFECRGKPSGIEVTKAKWFVTYFKYLDEIWYIKTQDLKNLLNEYAFGTTHNSGDKGSNTKGYLIPREIFKEKHFIVKYLLF